MSIERETKGNPNENEYKLKMLGREITIKTTFHPYRDPEQTTYIIEGDFAGTQISSGVTGVKIIGVTKTNDKEKLLDHLKGFVKDWMLNPRE